MKNRNHLGEILVKAGLLSQAALDAFSAEHPSALAAPLATALIDRGLVDDRDLARALSQELSVPWVSLAKAEPGRSVLSLVPRDVAERHTLVPVYVRREGLAPPTLYVATVDPTREEGLYTVAVFAGMAVRPLIAPRSEIRAAISRWYYRRSADERPTLPALSVSDADIEDLRAFSGH